MTPPLGSLMAERLVSSTFLSICVTLASSCNAPRPAGTPASRDKPPADAAPSAQETAQERVQRLEREARALARADGCAGSGECRAAPVGDRPCGGPRTYLVYCARTTDSVALYRKLDELAKAEGAYNQQQGLASTCEYRTPPRVEARGGSCRAMTP